MTLTQAERRNSPRRRITPGCSFRGTLAVLLTRDVGGLGPSWGYFIVAGGAALLVAALVAWQMSRRMARPLVEAMEATGRIAAGELDSRVPVRPGDYPEFASLAGSINGMAQSLQDGRARERHLLLSVSHDLRTPAHVHPRLRRGHSGRGDRGQRPGGRRDHRRVAAAGAPGRGPARSHEARGAADVDRHPPDRRRRGGHHDRGRVPACRGEERARHCAAGARCTTGCPGRHPRIRWRPTPTGWPSCWPTCWRTP